MAQRGADFYRIPFAVFRGCILDGATVIYGCAVDGIDCPAVEIFAVYEPRT